MPASSSRYFTDARDASLRPVDRMVRVVGWAALAVGLMSLLAVSLALAVIHGFLGSAGIAVAKMYRGALIYLAAVAAACSAMFYRGVGMTAWLDLTLAVFSTGMIIATVRGQRAMRP